MRGHLYERRPGVWLLRVEAGRDPLTGRRKQQARVVHGTRRDAEDALAELIVEVNRGQTPRTTATVALLLDRWFEHADGRLAPSTLREYRRLARQRIVPAFGDLRVDRLTTSMLDRFYAALEADLSARSIHQVHSVIRRAYQHGLRWAWVTSNPAAHAEPPPVRKRHRESMTPTQAAKALGVAFEILPEFGVYCRVVAATGARRGEVCALRLTDLDLDSRLIVVARSITTAGGRVEKGTKTHGVRTVSVDPATAIVLAAIVGRLRQRCETAQIPWAEDRFVFSHEIGGAQPWHPDTVSHWWGDVREKAGLPSWARLHDLRHAHASWLIDAGVPLPVVSRRLGHVNPQTTLSIYAHVVDARAADEGAGDLVGGLIDGTTDTDDDG